MLRVEDVHVRADSRTILDGIDLAVDEGETVAVLGPSGSGKTTLLRAIAGLQPLASGRVTWDRRDLAGVAPHRRKFGLMFQEYALFPHRDVAGNVDFGLRIAGVDRATRARRVDEVLDLVGLRDLASRRVASLSGGEQQRVALARALSVSPRLLMLDEPLGALDREWRARLIEEIRGLLQRARLPALYVTHDHDEAFAIAARVAVMRAGRIVQVGTPARVWGAPADAWIATFLGFGVAARAEVRGGVLCTPWGTTMRALGGIGDGPVDVVLRPDATRVDPDGDIAGAVERVTFAGTHHEIVVRPERGPDLRVAVRAAVAPRVGEPIRLAIDADGVLQYPVAAD